MDKKLMGKKSRANGKAFELKVRADLESKGWIVSKWSNQVEFEQIEVWDENNGFIKGKIIPAKSQFNPFFKRIIGEGSGFPDFIVYHKTDYIPQELSDKKIRMESIFGHSTNVCTTLGEAVVVIGVECKLGKYLDAKEKEKCKWLVDNKVFSKILIASKGETLNVVGSRKKIKTIKYEEFK